MHRITLDGGLRADILTYGGVIARLEAPDRAGRRGNVVLGLSDLASYETRSPSFGATIGRYAGRIGGASFMLDGIRYELPKNDGENTLHGGRGFGKRVWQVVRTDAASATLAYHSGDGEEGFPGRLDAEITFAVEDRTLRLAYVARTDRPTVLNLTNHAYFNLAGEGSGDVFGHDLEVAAEQILELDQHGIPTGAMLDVAATPFDFRVSRPIGEQLREAHRQIVIGLGYDACFVLRGAGMREAAVVRENSGGRVLTVRTDQPGLQVYTANKLSGALVGPAGRVYRSGDGLCLETQHFPDSPNRPAFPSTLLQPGEVFRSTTEYAFSIA